jgi:hypothetical protein
VVGSGFTEASDAGKFDEQVERLIRLCVRMRARGKSRLTRGCDFFSRPAKTELEQCHSHNIVILITRDRNIGR